LRTSDVFRSLWSRDIGCSKRQTRKSNLYQMISERKQQKEKKTKSLSNFIFIFLACSFLGVLIYSLFFSDFLRVNRIILEGIKELDEKKVNKSLFSYISGSYLKILPRNSLIAVSKGELRKNLMRDFKKIKGIKIEKKFPDAIKIKITERKSFILWCSGGPCYIIDENGYAYSIIDLNSEEVRQNKLVKLVDNSAKPISLGEKVLEREFVESISNIRERIKEELKFDTEEEFSTQARVSGDIKIKINDGFTLFIDARQPLEVTFSTLKIFLENEDIKKKTKDLEYVDLKVEGKVYYKFKDEEKEKTEEKEVKN